MTSNKEHVRRFLDNSDFEYDKEEIKKIERFSKAIDRKSNIKMKCNRRLSYQADFGEGFEQVSDINSPDIHQISGHNLRWAE